MSIRIRRIGARTVALCAARSVSKAGDVYLDDNQHAALVEKFKEDYGQGDLDKQDVAIRSIEESNNPNREWWDKEYT